MRKRRKIFDFDKQSLVYPSISLSGATVLAIRLVSIFSVESNGNCTIIPWIFGSLFNWSICWTNCEEEEECFKWSFRLNTLVVRLSTNRDEQVELEYRFLLLLSIYVEYKHWNLLDCRLGPQQNLVESLSVVVEVLRAFVDISHEDF